MTTVVRALALATEVQEVRILVPADVAEMPDGTDVDGVSWQHDDEPAEPSFRGELVWAYRRLPRLITIGSQVDWLITPYHEPVGRLPASTRSATFVHDICGLEFPKTRLNFYRHYVRLRTTAWLADRVLPVSEHTRREYVRRFPMGRERVTPPVLNAVLSPRLEADEIDRSLARFGLDRHRYVLAFGSVDPRKNFAGVLEGMRHYRMLGGTAELVCIARRKQQGKVTARATATVGGVRVISEISDHERDALYAGSLALLFPSTCEGFGYPVVEAMRQGCPPLAWRRGPAPELIGDAIAPLETLRAEEIGDRLIAIEKLEGRARAALSARLVHRSARFDLAHYARDLVAALNWEPEHEVRS